MVEARGQGCCTGAVCCGHSHWGFCGSSRCGAYVPCQIMLHRRGLRSSFQCPRHTQQESLAVFGLGVMPGFWLRPCRLWMHSCMLHVKQDSKKYFIIAIVVRHISKLVRGGVAGAYVGFMGQVSSPLALPRLISSLSICE